MDTPTKLKTLRKLMQKHQVNAFIVYSADPHMSEYLPEEWKEREWLSGFTGSAGLVVVTLDKAGLWTDSRYFVQATEELKNSGIELFKQGIEGFPHYMEWIKSEVERDGTVAINGLCCAHDDWQLLEQKLAVKDIKVKDLPLLAKLWDTRIAGEMQPIITQPLEYAGQSAKDKLAIIREKMQESNTTMHLVSSLDDIAWILNLRGFDVAYNPVFLSYLLITNEDATLFVNMEKCSPTVKKQLDEANVRLAEYEDFFQYLTNVKNQRILIAAHSNQTIFERLQDDNDFYYATPPSQLLKAVKNATEIEGMRKAMQKDGVALVHFLYWLKKAVGSEPLSEYEVGKKLLSFRAEQEGFQGASFGTIAGYNENGAIVHYSAKAENAKSLTDSGSLLLDSGGQYLEGTTDITRTIPLGNTSEIFNKDYTLVLKGMIALTLARFPKGSKGCNIDAIARQPLWQNLRNYGHGTGHGVGCFLNVHEGPQSIRQELKDQEILPGMITSNEPGLYREGEYGIRHENLILCKEDETSEFGNFYAHETLTICPFFTEPIIKELLNDEELKWLNEYNQWVYQNLSSELDEEHKNWLKEVCKSI
ncbi:Xaa-Pro aminopeptidase [Balneicella halophila]|uniref:Xaa-Pro aminopeptidase n=1 Tax=Balneicella halophila TaxID=1537566 RepID=A0A7L4UP60_BALHA|nr:aminopeptidase P family protein [Balneicella halophila]PVX49853.1 Xaa-Pro aminopeptidase [Balneicella halophila]